MKQNAWHQGRSKGREGAQRGNSRGQQSDTRVGSKATVGGQQVAVVRHSRVAEGVGRVSVLGQKGSRRGQLSVSIGAEG